ncbi:hypothetical protein Ga0100230_020415 [Opitutaceae bacterium TAV3]|nr:hypothetical protein Ga0100230_020415 [Opitutaceae bacterium TAV3]
MQSTSPPPPSPAPGRALALERQQAQASVVFGLPALGEESIANGENAGIPACKTRGERVHAE